MDAKEAILASKYAARASLSSLQDETRADLAKTRLSLLNALRPAYEHFYMMAQDEAWELVDLDTPRIMYKVVVISKDGTKFVSPFDGRTTYRLGATTSAALGATAYPLLHGGSLYCYEDIYNARHAPLPTASAAHRGRMHLAVECSVSGRCYRSRHCQGLWAVEHVRVLRYVGEPFFVQ